MVAYWSYSEVSELTSASSSAATALFTSCTVSGFFGGASFFPPPKNPNRATGADVRYEAVARRGTGLTTNALHTRISEAAASMLGARWEVREFEMTGN